MSKRQRSESPDAAAQQDWPVQSELMAQTPEGDDQQEEGQHAQEGSGGRGTHRGDSGGGPASHDQQDGAAEDRNCWVHTMVEELLEVEVKTELQQHLYPKAAYIKHAMDSLQFMVQQVGKQAEAEHQRLLAEQDRLAGLVANFQAQVSQVLPEVTLTPHHGGSGGGGGDDA